MEDETTERQVLEIDLEEIPVEGGLTATSARIRPGAVLAQVFLKDPVGKEICSRVDLGIGVFIDGPEGGAKECCQKIIAAINGPLKEAYQKPPAPVFIVPAELFPSP